jgi:hypothetical protein
VGSWVETASPHFVARHDVVDEDDVVGVLELLEGTREHLAQFFAHVPEDIDVVLHGSRVQLYAAHPELPMLLRLTAPAARRYLTGWPGSREIHLLAPRHLRARASNVPGSMEMAVLAPAALYAQVVVGANNRALPPPFRMRTFSRTLTWAWLWAGAGQWLSGQTSHARAAIGRRLHEGREPEFPPGLSDALLLGGSVLDLLAREEGTKAVVKLLSDPNPGTPQRALERAFGGRSLAHSAGAWRAHLSRMASAAG